MKSEGINDTVDHAAQGLEREKKDFDDEAI